MSYKLWASSEVLTAADLNLYLVSQSVPRFATTVARAAAIASPANGQLTWVDTQGLQVYLGSDWLTVTLIPVGGTTGQVLAKASDDDYDVVWVTP
jgi:hypothetical protein